jgi:hypothetical protein
MIPVLAINMSGHIVTNEPIEAYESPGLSVPEETVTTDIEVMINKGVPQTTVNDEVKLRETPIMFDFHDVDPKAEEEVKTKDEFQHLDPKSLKLLWHYRLGHLPFSTIN